MSWIKNFVRPKFGGFKRKRAIEETLWIKCVSCESMIFHDDFEDALKTCPQCGHHHRLSAAERLDMLFDKDKWAPIDLKQPAYDPLKFKDIKKYSDRLRDARRKTGMDDAIMVAFGEVDGENTVIAAFDFGFMGGSMGVGVGEALVAAARLAAMQNSPFIVVPASGGARMQEGILSLMQMPRTIAAIADFKESGLPYIVILTDPTTGGVSASFAMLGDIQIAESGAMIGFAGARVIEQTVREELPEGFQTAEFLLKNGAVDMVVERKDLKSKLSSLLGLLKHREPSAQIHKLNR